MGPPATELRRAGGRGGSQALPTVLLMWALFPFFFFPFQQGEKLYISCSFFTKRKKKKKKNRRCQSNQRRRRRDRTRHTGLQRASAWVRRVGKKFGVFTVPLPNHANRGSEDERPPIYPRPAEGRGTREQKKDSSRRVVPPPSPAALPEPHTGVEVGEPSCPRSSGTLPITAPDR